MMGDTTILLAPLLLMATFSHVVISQGLGPSSSSQSSYSSLSLHQNDQNKQNINYANDNPFYKAFQQSSSPTGSPSSLAGSEDDDDADSIGFPSFFHMPMRRPSFFLAPMRPNPIFEQMIESMNKQNEMMRKEMEKMPPTSETSEDVITMPNGRKYVKQCKTTKRGSGAIMMMETVCKMVPSQDTDTNQQDNTATPPSVLPDLIDQQRDDDNNNNNNNKYELISPNKGGDLDQQQQQNQGGASNKGDAINNNNDSSLISGHDDELKRQNIDETSGSETMTV